MYKGRLIWSAAAVAGYGLAVDLLNPVQTLTLGKVAGSQFEASDGAYLQTVGLMGVWGLMAVLAPALIAVLALIWLKPAIGMVRGLGVLAAAAVALAATWPLPAKAFYETTERSEAYTIKPNESAFWIPDVGNNKASQTQMDSEAYLKENKLSVKRFLIPHAKFNNSGGYMGWDAYVPTGRLIIVDRAPYTHEWVDNEHRGTSKLKEGFPCQTKEGLNVTAGVSVSTEVHEEDAATFLYHFGVKPPAGSPSDPQVIFTSVYYGRSLGEVMADNGRKRIGTLICKEFSKRTLDEVNAQYDDVMNNATKSATEYLAGVGITLKFMGWGDTLEFDPEVQKAINDKYVATTIRGNIEVLTQLQNLRVQEGLSKGLAEHGLPIVVTPDMLQAIAGLAAKSSAPATK